MITVKVIRFGFFLSILDLHSSGCNLHFKDSSIQGLLAVFLNCRMFDCSLVSSEGMEQTSKQPSDFLILLC